MICLCLHPLADDLIEAYVIQDDGTCWAVYERCPLHECRAIEVYRAPRLERQNAAGEEAALAGDSGMGSRWSIAHATDR